MVDVMEVPDIPLPEPSSDQSPTDHIQISRRLQKHFPIETHRGNRLQASEKVWGAVSHEISAVAKQRGWKHGNYNDKKAVARQVCVELAEAAATSPETEAERDARVAVLYQPYLDAYELHENFHQNDLVLKEIEKGEERASEFIKNLEEYREKGSKQYIPQYEGDQVRVAKLLGTSLKVRDYTSDYPIGKPVEWRIDRPGDDDGSGGGVPNPDPKPDGGQGGEGQSPRMGRDLNRRASGGSYQPVAAEEQAGKRGAWNRKRRSKEPKAPAQIKAAVGRGKERRRVIKPRAAAQRQSARR